MLDVKAKQRIIKRYQTHTNDTGSPQVQIAILTEEIKHLTGHLQTHRKDHSSRRGLLKKVNERKKMLRYLKSEDENTFNELVKKLKIKVRTAEEKSLDDLEQEELQKQKEKAEWEELSEQQTDDKE